MPCAAAVRSLPWRLLLPSVVILIAAALAPASELHSNQGDVGLYLEKARALASGLVPYRDFPFEYPPLALVPMVVPYLLWPFGRLAVEGYAWLFVVWEAALMLVLAIVLARIVRLGGASDDGAAGVDRAAAESERGSSMADRLVLVSIGAALAIAFRFDLFPALLVMVALWLSLERRPVAAGVAVGFGVLAKLYPLAIVPALAIPWLVPLDGPRLVRYGVAVVGSIVLVLLPFVALAGSDTFGFLSYQSERGLQVESIGGGLALLVGLINGHMVDMSFGFSAVQVAGPFADAWLAVLPALTVLGFGLLGWVGWRHVRRGQVPAATAVALTFASVLVLLATSKVFSIQYVVWIVPFAALLRGGKFWLAAAIIALTMPIHPLLYAELVKQHALPILVLNLRNALFLALTAWVLRDLALGVSGRPIELRGGPSSSAPRPTSTGSG
jgi:Glycosyltransferase family 87